MPELEPTESERLNAEIVILRARLERAEGAIAASNSEIAQLKTNTKAALGLMGRSPSARAKGKAGSYAFALFLSLLLAYFAYSAERKGKELELWQWLPISLLIGTSLGVQIDPETIGRFTGK